MIIKKYTAKTLEEAQAQIAKEMGGEAIVLTSRPIKYKGIKSFLFANHVEVIAAIDDPLHKTPSQIVRKTYSIPFTQQYKMALVGPSGAGKTTMAFKVASKYSKEGKKSALIILDDQRIGLQQYIETLSSHYQIPVFFAQETKELEGLMEALKKFDLIIIDTHACASTNEPRKAAIEKLLSHVGDVYVHLVLPSFLSTIEKNEMIQQYGNLQPDALIITKVDEKKCTFDLLNLPISFVSGGPEELVEAV